MESLRPKTINLKSRSSSSIKNIKTSRLKGLNMPSTRRKNRKHTSCMPDLHVELVKTSVTKGKYSSHGANIELDGKRNKFFHKRMQTRRNIDMQDQGRAVTAATGFNSLIDNRSISKNSMIFKPEPEHQTMVKQIRQNVSSLGLSSSISTLTLNHNSMIKSRLSALNNLNGESAGRINAIRNTDCRSLLKTACNEIKRVSYQLSTLVTDGEQHVQLFNGAPQNVELLESLPTYCKIMSKRHSAPCKVSLDYSQPEEIKSFKVKVFASYNEACPNKKNCNFKYYKKKVFSLYPLNSLERKFKNEYIYFALESFKSCSVNIKVDFMDEKPKPRKRTYTNAVDKDDLEDAEFEDPNSPIKDTVILKDVVDEPPQTDKIDKYVQQMTIWKRLSEKDKRERASLYKERRKKALSKKRELTFESIKQNIFYLNRWEYINKKKDELKQIKTEIENKMAFASSWWKIKAMHQHILPRIHDAYMVKKRQIAKAERIDRCVRRVADYFRSYLFKFGENKEAREAKMALHTF